MEKSNRTLSYQLATKKKHGLIFLLHVHSTGTAAPLLCSRYLLLVRSVLLLSSPPCSSSSPSLGGPGLAWPRGGSGASASGWRARKSWLVARALLGARARGGNGAGALASERRGGGAGGLGWWRGGGSVAPRRPGDVTLSSWILCARLAELRLLLKQF
jgi:hypothetical protein